ncbi:unnamed protein product [Cyprideis torosa]|uniref:Uncharacterized protein n=1 Tax=Cyprideis torosa TaxID=163714 RepID=A0A7R8ZIJ3_9CRUS|nr:unnamed protein product [Cyprideis torosa]CAG0884883.1 unnamed protein product [Cyprideis torosa]
MDRETSACPQECIIISLVVQSIIKRANGGGTGLPERSLAVIGLVHEDCAEHPTHNTQIKLAMLQAALTDTHREGEDVCVTQAVRCFKSFLFFRGTFVLMMEPLSEAPRFLIGEKSQDASSASGAMVMTAVFFWVVSVVDSGAVKVHEAGFIAMVVGKRWIFHWRKIQPLFLGGPSPVSLPSEQPPDSWVLVHTLQSSNGGGILDPDDRLCDVADDREKIVACYEEDHPSGAPDGTSSSQGTNSPELFQNVPLTSRNDIEITGEEEKAPSSLLQVRRGSEPALNKIPASASAIQPPPSSAAPHYSRPPPPTSIYSCSSSSSRPHPHGGRGGRRPNGGGWGSPGEAENEKNNNNNNSFSQYQQQLAASPGLVTSTPPPNSLLPPSAMKRWSASPLVDDDDQPPVVSTPHRPKTPPSIAIQTAPPQSASPPPRPPSSSLRPFSRDGHRVSSMMSGGSADKWMESADRVMTEIRREPLGGRSPDPDSQRELEITLSNSSPGPLGIHVVPYWTQSHGAAGTPHRPPPPGQAGCGGLLIQGIEEGGRVAADGRLEVGDRIVEINGTKLENTHFAVAQEVFRAALDQASLKLRVSRGRGSLGPRLGSSGRSSAGWTSSLGRRSKTPLSAFSDMVEGDEDTGPSSKLATVASTKPPNNALPTKGSGVPLSANTRKIGKILTIDLVKGVAGLGFSVTTRDNPAGGPAPIYVKNVLPKVNGQEMTGKLQSEAVEVLRAVPPGGKVALVVSRQDTEEGQPPLVTSPTKDKPGQGASSRSSSPRKGLMVEEDDSGSDGGSLIPWKHRDVLTLDIPIHDSERAGLGVSVKGKTSSTPMQGVVDLGIFIKNVIHGGAASRDGRLQTNDQLLSINGLSLLNKPNFEAMETLRRATHLEGPTPGFITLTIARKTANGHWTGPGDSYAPPYDSAPSEATDQSLLNHSATSEASSGANTVVWRSTVEGERSARAQQPKPPRGRTPGKSFIEDKDLGLDILPSPNPVVHRLTGGSSPGKSSPQQTGGNGFRNISYNLATHSPSSPEVYGVPPRGQSTLPLTSGPQPNRDEGVLILEDEYVVPPPNMRNNAAPNPQGASSLGKRRPSQESDVAYASQTSLEENLPGFSRDQPGRQSMSEKHKGTLDAKSTDTYQRTKRIREEKERMKNTLYIHTYSERFLFPHTCRTLTERSLLGGKCGRGIPPPPQRNTPPSPRPLHPHAPAFPPPALLPAPSPAPLASYAWLPPSSCPTPPRDYDPESPCPSPLVYNVVSGQVYWNESDNEDDSPVTKAYQNFYQFYAFQARRDEGLYGRPQHPGVGLRKSNSVESLLPVEQAKKGAKKGKKSTTTIQQQQQQQYGVLHQPSGSTSSSSAANRNRGCNESFRAAVDKSYDEATGHPGATRDDEDDIDLGDVEGEVAFPRGQPSHLSMPERGHRPYPRPTGSTKDEEPPSRSAITPSPDGNKRRQAPNLKTKKQKGNFILRGLGSMFRFGNKARSHSGDSSLTAQEKRERERVHVQYHDDVSANGGIGEEHRSKTLPSPSSVSRQDKPRSTTPSALFQKPQPPVPPHVLAGMMDSSFAVSVLTATSNNKPGSRRGVVHEGSTRGSYLAHYANYAEIQQHIRDSTRRSSLKQKKAKRDARAMKSQSAVFYTAPLQQQNGACDTIYESRQDGQRAHHHPPHTNGISAHHNPSSRPDDSRHPSASSSKAHKASASPSSRHRAREGPGRPKSSYLEDDHRLTGGSAHVPHQHPVRPATALGALSLTSTHESGGGLTVVSGGRSLPRKKHGGGGNSGGGISVNEYPPPTYHIPASYGGGGGGHRAMQHSPQERIPSPHQHLPRYYGPGIYSKYPSAPPTHYVRQGAIPIMSSEAYMPSRQLPVLCLEISMIPLMKPSRDMSYSSSRVRDPRHGPIGTVIIFKLAGRQFTVKFFPRILQRLDPPSSTFETFHVRIGALSYQPAITRSSSSLTERYGEPSSVTRSVHESNVFPHGDDDAEDRLSPCHGSPCVENQEGEEAPWEVSEEEECRAQEVLEDRRPNNDDHHQESQEGDVHEELRREVRRNVKPRGQLEMNRS